MKFESLAKHLANWRKRRNLTQTQAAILLETSIDTYRKWEQGISEPSAITEVGIRSKTK